jgi:uncharacterized protein YceH (UPF0502 family)
MLVQLTPHQARVIGVLLEKETTTPEQYPLSLNGVTLACNQKSNREPVMQLSESQVQDVIDELNALHLLFEEPSSRVTKYKHRFCNTEFSSLQFTPQQRAVVCVLLLRELRSRTNRLADFANVTEVEECLQSLHDHNGEKIVVRLEREPGKRESRYAHLFSGEPLHIYAIGPTSATDAAASELAHSSSSQAGQLDNSELVERVQTLEAQVKALQEQVELLTEMLE